MLSKTALIGILALVAHASALGEGAWKDPKHADEKKGEFAGMRYISAKPDAYEGLPPGIRNIKLASAKDIMGDDADKDGHLTWAEATKTGTPKPLFDAIDADHNKELTTAEAAKYVARQSEPLHVELTIVGSDDGENWWHATGYADGKDMSDIHIDFSGKGGPSDAVAKWSKSSDNEVHLTFADGNAWHLEHITHDSKGIRPPKRKCNCGCGKGSGQCGLGCGSCECEGCVTDGNYGA